MMIKINGKVITLLGDKIKSITYRNGSVFFIDNDVVNLKNITDDYVVNIEINGDVAGDIITNGNVTVLGNCNNVDANGNVEIGGNINGNVDTNGDVYCSGDITGDIDANGRVSISRK